MPSTWIPSTPMGRPSTQGGEERERENGWKDGKDGKLIYDSKKGTLNAAAFTVKCVILRTGKAAGKTDQKKKEEKVSLCLLTYCCDSLGT